MKTLKQLTLEGYNLLAIRGNSTHVFSFIALKNGAKVYGYYDHTLYKYIIESY